MKCAKALAAHGLILTVPPCARPAWGKLDMRAVLCTLPPSACVVNNRCAAGQHGLAGHPQQCGEAQAVLAKQDAFRRLHSPGGYRCGASDPEPALQHDATRACNRQLPSGNNTTSPRYRCCLLINEKDARRPAGDVSFAHLHAWSSAVHTCTSFNMSSLAARH